MKIGFLVNDVMTEHPLYTTTHLTAAAVNLGHESYVWGVGDFSYAPDGSIHAHARKADGSRIDSHEDYVESMQDEERETEPICVDDLDVLFVRNVPSDELAQRPWAQTSGNMFCQLAAARGVLVVNDPSGLLHALNKTYFQHFPEIVRPKTLISRDNREIREFIEAQHDKVVIKPLQGCGGQSVFLVDEDEKANVNQMIEAVTRDGYCIVQEYLPAAVDGDVRMFVMNGKPLEFEGKYAAFRRVNDSGDARSNMHAGGKSVPVEVTDQTLKLVEMVRPKLIRDGMFLVGLDIVENKLMELNVYSPGGLTSIRQHTGVDFGEVIIRDLERKVRYKNYYGGSISNAVLATL
ncbi:glutathione synthetase [Rubinisphaera margarita]|uniref:glutathione synthetase n=1 Tax=Rubinisphaera margarita TaxID=2909586 RepID=UPI001EE874A2|nr:glutathione synthetase [Rubinisphaera margarita]MCG6154820.1 ATP-grasp domain-containing protein [Rubinisphaera margarita]